MSAVCREFGISRKTGYKIFNRYKDDGFAALTDRSRPVRLRRGHSTEAGVWNGRANTAPGSPTDIRAMAAGIQELPETAP